MVSTLLPELRRRIDRAVAKEGKGGKGTKINLCDVSVPGSNLFCAENKGIPRLKMPQLKAKPPYVEGSPASKMKLVNGEVDLGPAFIKHLAAKGIKTTNQTIDAKYLKASQNELDSNKVTGMIGAMKAGTMSKGSIFVTNDDYVVDGHHRWAATVGHSYVAGKSLSIDTKRIDADIITILDEANKFTKAMGIPQQDM